MQGIVANQIRLAISSTLDVQRVFRRNELGALLETHRIAWQLPSEMSTRGFIDYLKATKRLKRIRLSFPTRNETLYAWGDVPLESILLAIKPNCHFTHHTAARMHELTEQDPKTIYLNVEQPPKPAPAGGLAQGRIDAAFARKPRLTTNVARFDDLRIFLLNGKSTGYLGVETREVVVHGGPGRARVRVTDIERTLIDIAVRPFYAGGVAEVLKAYRNAGERASVNRIAALLRQIGHVYPYHQAIGYYLERSEAFSPSVIELFRSKFPFEFDFYLTYEMKKTRYDARWRLHVPEGF